MGDSDLIKIMFAEQRFFLRDSCSLLSACPVQFTKTVLWALFLVTVSADPPKCSGWTEEEQPRRLWKAGIPSSHPEEDMTRDMAPRQDGKVLWICRAQLRDSNGKLSYGEHPDFPGWTAYR